MNKNPILVVIVGPTAVGKTAISIDIASALGAEIISADSRQFYREMEIGTAKPSIDELTKIPHHLINSHSITDSYDAGAFAVDVHEILDQLFAKQQVAVMVGGSGLYVRSVCEGLDDMPLIPDGIRQDLINEVRDSGLEALLLELKEQDLEYYEKIDHGNKQRIIRALEVIRTSGKPYTEFRKLGDGAIKRPYTILKIGIEADRAELYQRIDDRMDVMIEKGLFQEAKKLYIYKDHNALQTVGYKEIFDYLEGKYDKNEAIRLLKRNSRRYAKRQMTWFKKDQNVNWFRLDQYQQIMELIEGSKKNYAE